MKNLFYRFFGRKASAETAQRPQPSAQILPFKPRPATGQEWERLVQAMTGPSQTNANIIKFPRYRRQYKPGLRPVTRR